MTFANLRKSDYWHFVILGVIIFLAFINVYSMGFVWDDLVQIRDNKHLTDISHLKDVFWEDTGSATSSGDDYTP